MKKKQNSSSRNASARSTLAAGSTSAGPLAGKYTITYDPPIPESFTRGMAECLEGKAIDFDAPPSRLPNRKRK